MADRKVKYILEVDYTGESVTARAADDLREVDDAAVGASEGLEQAGSGFSKVQAGIVTMQSALGIAEQGFAAIQQAAQFAYETLSEGADLMLAADHFDSLANSIGTTAEALTSELTPAMGGLVTNAEMVAGAGQLISLGLAGTHEEVVALSEVAGKLNWDMQVLGLTLANQSTMRLDALGLSVDSVKSKLEAFKEQGMSTEAAFKWAVIEAGREKMEILGDATDTAAGKLQILENIVANVQDEFARGAAEAFADTLGDIAGNAPAAAAGMELMGLGAGHVLGSLPEIIAGLTSIDDYMVLLGITAAGVGYKMGEDNRIMAAQGALAADTFYEMAGAAVNLADGVEISTDAADAALWVWAEYIQTQDVMAASAAMAAENAYYLAGAMESQAEAAERAAEAEAAAAEAQAAWAAYTTEMTAWGGDTFTMFSQSDEVWNFAEAVYGAADAAGAGAGPLSELAVALGLVDEATAAAALDATAQQSLAESIAGAAVAGKVMWEDYIATVERAQRVMSGEEVINMFPGPVSQIGPRAQLPEEDLIAMGENMPTFEVEITADTQAVLDAVETATGVVEGFAESDPKVTMYMDIDEVESKAGRATELIEGIPEVKQVRIDVTATGMEILEELRAMGALP